MAVFTDSGCRQQLQKGVAGGGKRLRLLTASAYGGHKQQLQLSRGWRPRYRLFGLHRQQPRTTAADGCRGVVKGSDCERLSRTAATSNSCKQSRGRRPRYRPFGLQKQRPQTTAATESPVVAKDHGRGRFSQTTATSDTANKVACDSKAPGCGQSPQTATMNSRRRRRPWTTTVTAVVGDEASEIVRDC